MCCTQLGGIFYVVLLSDSIWNPHQQSNIVYYEPTTLRLCSDSDDDIFAIGMKYDTQKNPYWVPSLQRMKKYVVLAPLQSVQN